MRLTNTQAEHLQRLAHQRDAKAHPTIEPSELAQLVRVYSTPAVAYDHTWHVLSYNTAFKEAVPSAAETPNLLMWYFTNPEARRLFLDWETEAAEFIARLRTIQGYYSDLGAFNALTKQLSQASAVAAKLWAAGVEVSEEPTRKVYRIRQSNGSTKQCKVMQLQPSGRSDPSIRIAVFLAAGTTSGG